MVIGHVDLFELEPSLRTFSATRYFRGLNYACAHSIPLLARGPKVLFEEDEEFLPAFNRRLLTIRRTIIIEEAVPRLRVHVKLVRLSVLRQLVLQHWEVLRWGLLVFLTSETSAWTV